MGIHVGEPDVDESTETGSSFSKNTRVDYIGPAVNKTARVAAAAKGGQVVLSTAAREELETCLGKVFQFGVLRDLGPVTFKGLNKTENIHEFVVANLERNFDNPESQTVAIKKFFRQKVDSVTLYEIEHQIKEIAVLAEVRHPSILLFEAINDKAILMGQASSILTSVCNGMVYLHMSNIIHRDLNMWAVFVFLFMSIQAIYQDEFLMSNDDFDLLFSGLSDGLWDNIIIKLKNYIMTRMVQQAKKTNKGKLSTIKGTNY
eukprot:m51a1_g11257 putative adenylate guanylate cyclase domain-containing protein (260) ;mRNA; f:193-10385